MTGTAPMTQAEYFLELELAEILGHDDQLMKGTIGPLMAFTKKHAALHSRLTSGVEHVVNPEVEDVSGAANAELESIGIDPKVFLGAYAIAESDVAGVLGW